MLTDAEKKRIRAEENFRNALRAELAPEPVRKPFLSADNVKWLLATLVVPASVWIWGEVDKANHRASLVSEKAIAETRLDVDQLTALLPGLSSTDPKQRSLSLVVLGHLVSARHASSPLVGVYNEISNKVQDDRLNGAPEAKAAAAQTNGSLLIGKGATAPSPPTAQDIADAKSVPVAAPPPVSAITSENFVYIQVYRANQKAPAQKLRASLERRAGVSVLGIENVVATQGPTVLKVAQKGAIDIRYYHAEDRAAALSLTPIVAETEPDYGAPTVHDLSSRKSKARRGAIEIWYPCGPAGATCAQP